MTGPILFEGRNLTLSAGTGIATYARNLNAVARGLGYRTEVLLGARSGLDAKDPVLSEIRMFDAQPPQPSRSYHLQMRYRALVGKPLGIRPVSFRLSGMVVNPSANFDVFDRILAAPDLFDMAERHFRRYGRCATVKLDAKPALFHATHPTPLRVPGCPNIYTIHDLVPLRLPYATLDDKKYHLSLLRRLCAQADHIVTVSEFSRRDIIAFLGIPEERITNTYQSVGIPEHLLAPSDDEVADDVHRAFGLDLKEYFLFVGAIEPKKNIGRLLDAYVSSGTKRPLVIAGGLGWQYEEDLERIEDERFVSYRITEAAIVPDRRVRRLPYLRFEQLIALLRGARALLFPSIYEGFGLPALEAMLVGTPVMTSNIASLPEVVGDAAVLADPFNVQDMADAIRALDDDADLRAELGQRGRQRALMFSKERYEERLAALYRRLLH